MSRKLVLIAFAAVAAVSVPVAARVAFGGRTAEPASRDVTVEQSRVQPIPPVGASGAAGEAEAERLLRQRRAEYLERGSGQVPWYPGR